MALVPPIIALSKKLSSQLVTFEAKLSHVPLMLFKSDGWIDLNQQPAILWSTKETSLYLQLLHNHAMMISSRLIFSGHKVQLISKLYTFLSGKSLRTQLSTNLIGFIYEGEASFFAFRTDGYVTYCTVKLP